MWTCRGKSNNAFKISTKDFKIKNKTNLKTSTKSTLNPCWIIPDLPASCSQCFHQLDSYKWMVLDFQKYKCHHQLQLWIWSMESWFPEVFQHWLQVSILFQWQGNILASNFFTKIQVKLNWFLVKYVIINSLPRHTAKICSAFSSSHSTQEEITQGIFKHSCKLPNIIKVASVTARWKLLSCLGFFKNYYPSTTSKM